MDDIFKIPFGNGCSFIGTWRRFEAVTCLKLVQTAASYFMVYSIPGGNPNN